MPNVPLSQDPDTALLHSTRSSTTLPALTPVIVTVPLLISVIGMVWVTGNYVRSTGNEIMPLCQQFAPTVNPPTDNHENWLLLSGMNQWFVARLSHWMFSAQKP